MTLGDGRTLDPTVITGFAATYASLVSAMGGVAGAAGGPLSHIVWHKHLSAAPNTTELVLTATMSNILASQRRRLRKVSRHRR